MNITVETQPNCRATLHIEIPSSDVKRERESVVTNYARKAKIPGFRPGKVPKQVVARKFASEIQEDLQNALLRLGYQQAEERKDLEILSVVGVKDSAMHPDESFTFTLEVSTAPHFELPEYKGIPIKLPRVEATDADVEHELLHLREHHRAYHDLDREAAIGDYLVIDATGSVDGQPVADAYPEAPAPLKKMDGSWIQLTTEEKIFPGFFAMLVGIKKDETREVNIVLPEEFGFEPLRGKTVTLNVTAKGVKEGVLPTLDDEFAKKLNEELDLAKLREAVRANIIQRREQSREERKTNEVVSFLAQRLEFELPQDVVNREAQRRTNDIAMNALRQGMNQEAIMAVQDQIVVSATQQARQNVKVGFILGEVAKRENLTVTEQQIQMALIHMAQRQRVTPKKLLADAKKSNLLERLQEDLLIENALQFLKDNAAIEESEPEKDDCGHTH